MGTMRCRCCCRSRRRCRCRLWLLPLPGCSAVATLLVKSIGLKCVVFKIIGNDSSAGGPATTLSGGAVDFAVPGVAAVALGVIIFVVCTTIVSSGELQRCCRCCKG